MAAEHGAITQRALPEIMVDRTASRELVVPALHVHDAIAVDGEREVLRRDLVALPSAAPQLHIHRHPTPLLDQRPAQPRYSDSRPDSQTRPDFKLFGPSTRRARVRARGEEWVERCVAAGRRAEQAAREPVQPQTGARLQQKVGAEGRDSLTSGHGSASECLMDGELGMRNSGSVLLRLATPPQ